MEDGSLLPKASLQKHFSGSGFGQLQPCLPEASEIHLWLCPKQGPVYHISPPKNHILIDFQQAGKKGGEDRNVSCICDAAGILAPY